MLTHINLIFHRLTPVHLVLFKSVEVYRPILKEIRSLHYITQDVKPGYTYRTRGWIVTVGKYNYKLSDILDLVVEILKKASLHIAKNRYDYCDYREFDYDVTHGHMDSTLRSIALHALRDNEDVLRALFHELFKIIPSPELMQSSRKIML